MNDLRHSPGNLLANFYQSPEARLILLSGSSGCGKTTFCLLLAHLAMQQHITVQGIVSPPVVKSGSKIAIDLLPLPSGPSRRLARRRESEITGLYTDDWLFDPVQVAWGDQHLATLQDAQLLIIDELGPLEFLQGRGWQAAFSLIDARAYRLAVVVIRPSLLNRTQARWPSAETLVLSRRTAESEPSMDGYDPH